MKSNTRTRRLGAAALVAAGLFLGGCDNVQDLTAGQPVPAATWQNVYPVFQKSCLPCHGTGNTPAFKDEATTGPEAKKIRDAVSEGWMPAAGTVHFSQADKALLLRWADSAMTLYTQKQGG